MTKNSNSHPAYSTKIRAMMFLGRPLSPIYSGIMQLRSFLYQQGILKKHRLPVKVISIGNLTMGGTGKTPVVLYLAKLLKKNGRQPAVLSRGYRGKAGNSYNVVSDGKKIMMSAEECGDEPRMLAESLPNVPVLIAKKRINAGRFICEHMAIDTIILDDGFQHLALHRDLDIVVFTARSFIDRDFVNNSRVIPGGELRESFSALQRADAFIITGIDDSSRPRAEEFTAFLKNNNPGCPVFQGEYLPTDSGPETPSGLSMAEAKKLPVYAFCGIAVPESFKDLLVREKFNLVGFKAFQDHRSYTANDLQQLNQKAKAAGAQALITTAKDMVKIKALDQDGLPVITLDIDLHMNEEFDRFIIDRILDR